MQQNNDQPQTGFQVHWPEFSKQESGFPEDAAGQAERIDYLCDAGVPFKMHTFPNTFPNTLTHWVLGTDRAEDKTIPFRRDATAATAESYGPPSRRASARFRPRDNNVNNSTAATPLQFNNLVVDDSGDRTGAALCESPTSVGPDFVNVVDGTFCRMSDKTLFPVCDSDGTTDNCFDLGAYRLVVGGVSARDTPYDKVLDWTSKGSRSLA